MHNESHKDAVFDQSDVSAFLRELRGTRTNESIANAIGAPYPTVQKWFLSKPGRLEAVNFLRVVIALKGEEQLLHAIRDWRERTGQDAETKALTGDYAPIVPREKKVAEQAPARPIAKKAGGSVGRSGARSPGAKARKQG